jgi:hypothetical protein
VPESVLRLLVGLQVKTLAGDQGDEPLVDVEAPATEHPPCACGAQRGEQFQAMRHKRIR